MPEKTAVDGILKLLDSYTLQILAITAGKPVAVAEISSSSDIPASTLYRRLERLTDTGVVESETRIDASGNHYNVYETALEQFHLDVKDGRGVIRVVFDVDGDDVLEYTYPAPE